MNANNIPNNNKDKITDKIKKTIFDDRILLKLSLLCKERDIPLYLVGGYLRDILIEAQTPNPRIREKQNDIQNDYDFTLALPIQGTPSLFQSAPSPISMIEDALGFRFFKVGKEETHTVTFRIINEIISVDLTPLQGQSIDEDLQRRDFTINTLAFSLRDETFHWAATTIEDLEKKTIRPVSDRSIDLDPLRMLRAVRYFCTLGGFTIENELKKEIISQKNLIVNIPGERIKAELDRILLSPHPGEGLKYLLETGLLLTLIPELGPLENLGQGQYHHLDALSHTLTMVEKIAWAITWVEQKGTTLPLEKEDRLSLCYASLFHDIGKQNTYSINDDGDIHFFEHEAFSCRAAKEIMDRLRFSNHTAARILRLIQNHMRILTLSPETKHTALKRLIYHMAEETPLLVLHTLADKEASRGPWSVEADKLLEDHCLKILKLYEEKEIVHPMSLIKGDDVIALGYSPGPAVGEILRYIREKQIDGEITDRQKALQILKQKFGK